MGRRWAWGLTLLLTAARAAAFAAAPLCLPLIQEPELPGLAPRVLASGRIAWAAGSVAAAAVA
ncbi:MAG: glycosyltransferase family 39 protein, partial [Prochlorococcaceae cyanobacterium]